MEGGDFKMVEKHRCKYLWMRHRRWSRVELSGHISNPTARRPGGGRRYEQRLRRVCLLRLEIVLEIDSTIKYRINIETNLVKKKKKK